MLFLNSYSGKKESESRDVIAILAAAAVAPRVAEAASTYEDSTGQTTVMSAQTSRLSAGTQPCAPASPHRRTSPGVFLVPRTFPPSSLFTTRACEAHVLSSLHSALWVLMC